MPQDTGIYTCVAVNDHGSASSSASIKVQGSGLNDGFIIIKEDPCLASDYYKLGGGFVIPDLSLAGIPAAPGRPVAQEASSSAVMVHWPPPASSTHCTISSYTVEYRQEGI